MKTGTQKTSQEVRVGFGVLHFSPEPIERVRKAYETIQKNVQPAINEQKRIRNAAEQAASKIILNA